MACETKSNNAGRSLGVVCCAEIVKGTSRKKQIMKLLNLKERRNPFPWMG
jgi:hypothetical protein